MPGIECGNPQPEIELRRVGRLDDDDIGVGLDAHISQNRWILRALLYQDCTIPQACCQAQRCQRSDSDVDTSVSGMAAYLSGWRTSWAISQSTYACTTCWCSAANSSSLCILLRLARSSLMWVIAFFILQFRNDALSLALRAPLAVQPGAKRSHNTDKILDQVFLPVLCQVDDLDLATLHRQPLLPAMAGCN